MNQQQLHWISGIHAVRAALKHGAGQVIELWADKQRDDRRLKGLLKEAQRQGIKASMVERKMIESKVGKVNHQGVAACTPLPATGNETSLDELLSQLDEAPLLLILDGVTDPHNLGACLRTADATGVHAVIAPRDKSVGLTPAVCKVASGAAATVPFIQVTNLARTLRHLQENHRIFLVGLASDSDQTLYTTDLCGRLGFVVGAEGAGLRRLTRDNCDQLAALPMQGSVESLNVSVATGVCLYEALRQRC